jgi:hypothetical protein
MGAIALTNWNVESHLQNNTLDRGKDLVLSLIKPLPEKRIDLG